MVSDYVKKNSQETDEKIIRQHIELYVNNFSVDLGDKGRTAIKKLYSQFQRAGGDIEHSPSSKDLFIS